MSKSELKNSASEDKKNRTEESETSDDEYLPDLTKLQLYMYESHISKESLKESCLGKESSDSEEDSSRIGDTLLCYCSKCKSKASHAESICSLDKEEIPESYFEGIISSVLEIFLSSNVSKEQVKTQLC